MGGVIGISQYLQITNIIICLLHFRFVSVNDVYVPTDDGSKSKVR